MVDVVPNHFAAPGPAEDIDYSTLNPFNSESYFHPICWITDYNNQTNVEVVRRRLPPCACRPAF